MKLSQLKKLVKEELEVILTNKEVGEFFGEDVRQQIEEAGFFPDSAEEEEAEAADLSAQAGSVNVEPMEEAGHKGEGTMARSQLARTGELAHMLEKMIGDDTNLPEWVESKVTKAQDYLSSVLNYMRGEDLVDAGDAAREMKAAAAVVNRGPLQEADEAEMIARLEVAIENARELVDSLPKDQRAEQEEVLNRLETRYDHIMSGRVQNEEEDRKLPPVAPKDIDRLRRTHTADYKRHQAARKKMKK